MLVLKFTSFNVENHPECSYDSLSVWENEPDVGTLLGTFCGTSLPADITSHENIVLDFRSDRIGRNSGFRAVYELIYSGIKSPGEYCRLCLSRITHLFQLCVWCVMWHCFCAFLLFSIPSLFFSLFFFFFSFFNHGVDKSDGMVDNTSRTLYVVLTILKGLTLRK